MLNQDFVLALLQASITGAGLVLAIYTLIIPLSRSLFKQRGVKLLRDLGELRKRVMESEINVKDAEKLKELIDKIAETQTVPRYLGLGRGLAFLGYIASTLMSVGWLIEWSKTIMDEWLTPIFVFTTFMFLAVGLSSIKDIHGILKKEYEQIKRELEDVKSKKM